MEESGSVHILDVTHSVRDAENSIVQSRDGLAIVLDDDERYVGMLTEEHLTAALEKDPGLASKDLSSLGRLPSPSLPENSSPLIVRRFLQENNIALIPFTRRSGKLSRLLTRDEALHTGLHENPVVVMAGGFGMRLRPITANIPKPLIPLVEGTLLDRILDHLLDCGFHRYHVAVHYLKEEIMATLGDGTERGVSVDYIIEETPLGTAGSLADMMGRTDLPIIVTNGDVITNQDFAEILAFHRDTNAKMTIVCKEDGVDISYGVVEADENGELLNVNEKPRLSYLINTGIYIIDPSILPMVPHKQFFMTDLINMVREKGGKVAVFQTNEYWKDVGTIDCYAQVIKDIRTGLVRSFPPPKRPARNNGNGNGSNISPDELVSGAQVSARFMQ